MFYIDTYLSVNKRKARSGTALSLFQTDGSQLLFGSVLPFVLNKLMKLALKAL